MSTRKPFVLLSVMISSLLLLSACGDSDSDNMSAPAESMDAPAMTESSSDGMDSSMSMEKAEGVIYQDEIYANWPYN
jgi:major membrane immunogen (membrane-anchored lipoprotein)